MNNHPHTRAQKLFLQTLIQNPAGPAPQDWPSPAIFRRWLRSPHFRQALESVRQANIVLTDFALSQAAASAATSLADSLLTPHDNPDYQIPWQSFQSILAILKQQHIRSRFPNPTSSSPRQLLTPDS